MALTKNITFAEGEIGNAIKSTSEDHVVAAAQNIYDGVFEGGGYQSEINEFLNKKISDLGKVVNLKGVYTSDKKLSEIIGVDGDFIIVGNKEYVYWSGDSISGEDETNWVLLGDTTILSQNLTNLTTSFNNHTHTTDSKGLTISYSNGTLTITSAHKHAVNPTGT